MSLLQEGSSNMPPNMAGHSNSAFAMDEVQGPSSNANGAEQKWKKNYVPYKEP